MFFLWHHVPIFLHITIYIEHTIQSILKPQCLDVHSWRCGHWHLWNVFVFSVVSTVVSVILFARFPTVECISKVCSFLLWRHNCSKKVPVEKESKLSRGVGLLLSSHSFAKITFIGNNTLWVDPATHAEIVSHQHYNMTH